MDEQLEATFDIFSGSLLSDLEKLYTSSLEGQTDQKIAIEYATVLAASRDRDRRLHAIEILSRQSSNPYNTFLLARALYSVEEFERARNLIEGLLRGSPDDLQVKRLWQAISFKHTELIETQKAQLAVGVGVGLGVGLLGVGLSFLLSKKR